MKYIQLEGGGQRVHCFYLQPFNQTPIRKILQLEQKSKKKNTLLIKEQYLIFS